MPQLANRLLQFVRRHGLLTPGQRLVAGFSGGPDSVALVLLLGELRRRGRLPLSLTLAHLNHGLRGAEADADEEWCRQFARKRGLSIVIDRADVAACAAGRSLEEAARQMRYEFLARVACNTGADTLATAHHADDAAETVLLRMVRGAGVRGLGAMAAAQTVEWGGRSVRHVRPLLEFSKAELLDYLQRSGQDYRVDSSNADTAHLRNRVRHELLPFLERRFPAFSVGSLAALNRSACELDAALGFAVTRCWPDLCRCESGNEIILDAGAFAELPSGLRKAAAGRAVSALTGLEPPPLASEHYDRLAALADGGVGKTLDLPHGVAAHCEHGVVRFARGGRAPVLAPCQLLVPGRVRVPVAGMELRAERVEGIDPTQATERADADRVFVRLGPHVDRLHVRARRPGDKFRPLGAPGSRRLKKFFIDAGVPRQRRDAVPLVTTAGGRIVWVVGQRIAHEFRLQNGAGGAVELRADRLPGQGQLALRRDG